MTGKAINRFRGIFWQKKGSSPAELCASWLVIDAIPRHLWAHLVCSIMVVLTEAGILPQENVFRRMKS